MDYELYAEGEARLGWLNATAQLNAEQAFDADDFLGQMAQAMHRRLKAASAEVAHLKMTLSPDGPGTSEGPLAAVSLVRNDWVPEASSRLGLAVRHGRLTVNLRAEAAPDVLGQVLRGGLASALKIFPGLSGRLDHLEHFRPGKPMPTHRLKRLPAS